MNYFIGDPHLSHKKIIQYGRKQFNTVEEHDKFFIDKIYEWAERYNPGDTFWVLGDWGNIDYLYIMDAMNTKGIITKFVRGNHDKAEDMNTFRKYFQEVYEYPVYISNKLVVSHVPVAVYDDTINIHGHTHRSYLKDINHIPTCLDVIDYQPVSDRQIQTRFSKIPKYTRRFLWEPFAQDYVFLDKNRPDVVTNRNGEIDLSASRVLQKLSGGKKPQDYPQN